MATLLTQEIGQLMAGKINDNKAAIRANSSAITTINAALEALNGTGDGSVDKKIADAIDTVIDGAPDTFNTLKELSDWITDDQTGAAAMGAAIAANQSSITTIQQAVKNLEDNALEVDTALSLDSENPVQNKAVKAALDEIVANGVVVDSALDAASENPVQNKIISSAITTINTAISNIPSYDLLPVATAESWFS